METGSDCVNAGAPLAVIILLAGDNLADGDGDEEYDDDDGIINADDNQIQMTKITMIMTLMT